MEKDPLLKALSSWYKYTLEGATKVATVATVSTVSTCVHPYQPPNSHYP